MTGHDDQPTPESASAAQPDAGYVILVRHAHPEIDPDLDPEDWPLSFEGRAAATQLADILEEYDPDVIVTSQLPKAFETGRILAENLFLPVETVPGLQEVDRRDVGWLKSGEFRDRLADSMARPSETVFGAESADEAMERFRAAVEAVLALHPTETVVIVTHGTVMSLFVAAQGDSQAFDLWDRLELPAFVVLRRPDLAVERIAEQPLAE